MRRGRSSIPSAIPRRRPRWTIHMGTRRIGATSRFGMARPPATSRLSLGRTPLIIDTNGNGKRDEYVEANQPVDPKKDKRIMAAFYGVQPSTVDDSIWGQSMDVGFSRMDQAGYVIRLSPGSNPPETALA